MGTKQRVPWSFPVRYDELPETGRQVSLNADASVRAAIAGVAGLPGISRLEAAFEVARHGRDGLRVTGRVSGTVQQTCVVTLEPLVKEIDEAVELVFVPAAGDATGDRGRAESAAVLAPPDASEPLVGGVVDLGAVAAEFLILGLDPYPRKAGARFEQPDGPDEGAHAFAALAALKKQDNPSG